MEREPPPPRSRIHGIVRRPVEAGVMFTVRVGSSKARVARVGSRKAATLQEGKAEPHTHIPSLAPNRSLGSFSSSLGYCKPITPCTPLLFLVLNAFSIEQPQPHPTNPTELGQTRVDFDHRRYGEWRDTRSTGLPSCCGRLESCRQSAGSLCAPTNHR